MSVERIQFNGRCLVQPLTGVQRYVRELSLKLSDQMIVLKPSQLWAQGVRGHLWEQVYLPRLCDRRLLWSPGNTGPLCRDNQVVTMHDASTLDCPECFERKFAELYTWLLPRLARRVRAIITVSAFSKERLVERLGVSEAKIHVIRNGLSEDFRPRPASECGALLAQLDIRNPFFLHVGSVEPRKNLACLLKAWRLAALQNWHLVLVGDRTRIFQSVKLEHDLPGVKFTGRLNNDQLRQLYSGAHAFVSATVYEGFGLAPLEAMACGCPCLISDIPAHREMCADAPVYVPARSARDWADAIRGAAAWTPLELESRRQRGLRVTEHFSWHKAAEQTLAVLSSFS